jgi:hypothetical protein
LSYTSKTENGCQGWTRTNTSGLTGRRATLTLPGKGKLELLAGFAPASIRLEDECLISLGHSSSFKMVGMAGFSPATTRSQAGCSED